MLRVFRRVWPFFLIVLFIFLFRLGFFNFFRETLEQSLSSLSKVFHPFSKVFVSFRSQQELALENKKLREEILGFKAELAQLIIFKEENELLRENLNFSKNLPYQVKQAQIIGKRIDANSIFYLLDRGELDGLKKDLAVIQINGYLVGKIFKVERNFSLFLPLTNNYFSAAVDVVSREALPDKKGKIVFSTSGLAQGKYGILTEVDLVPLDRQIKIGDYIITSGLEELIPRGLLLGEVGKIEMGTNRLFQRLIIDSPIKFDDLRMVGVVVK